MAFLTLDRYTDQPGTRETAQIKALIFDVEGVIIDSVGAQFEAFKRAVMGYTGHTVEKKTGEIMTARDIFLERMARLLETEPGKYPRYDDFIIEHYHALISGRSREGGIRNLLALPRSEDATPEENALVIALCQEKDDIFQKMLDSGEVKAFPAAVEMIRKLYEAGIPMAFASGSSNAAIMLYKAEILDKFQIGVLKGRAAMQKDKYVLLRDPSSVKLEGRQTEVPAGYFEICNPQFHGKPMPWIFHRAAREMEIDPFKCAVFEDSPQVTDESYEEGFGALVGVDTGNAFHREQVRSGNAFYCEKGETPDDVANKMRDYILSRLRIPVDAADLRAEAMPLTTRWGSGGPTLFAGAMGNGNGGHAAIVLDAAAIRTSHGPGVRA